MKNTKSSFKFVASIITLFVVTILFIVSVLGENNTAKSIIDRYIAALATSNIVEIKNLSSKHLSNKFTSDAEVASFHNALGIALFDHFNIKSSKDYLLNVSRENTWFPLIGSDNLHFDFQMQHKNDASIFSNTTGKEVGNILTNFFVLTREDGGWKIRDIDTKNNAIVNKLEYIADQNITLSEVKISSNGKVSGLYKNSSQELTSIQKRIIINKMQSAIQKLQNGDKIN